MFGGRAWSYLKGIKAAFRENVVFKYGAVSGIGSSVHLVSNRWDPNDTVKGIDPGNGGLWSCRVTEFSDLDIFVQQKDIPAAYELLSTQGYKPANGAAGREDINRTFAAGHHHLCLVHEEKRLHLEVHWRFAQEFLAFPLHETGFRERLTQLQMGGASIACLPPEDLLLFLCAHGAKHIWERLLWLCDVREVLRSHPDLDWEHLLDVPEV